MGILWLSLAMLGVKVYANGAFLLRGKYILYLSGLVLTAILIGRGEPFGSKTD